MHCRGYLNAFYINIILSLLKPTKSNLIDWIEDNFFCMDKNSLSGFHLSVPPLCLTLGSWVPGPTLGSWVPILRTLILKNICERLLLMLHRTREGVIASGFYEDFITWKIFSLSFYIVCRQIEGLEVLFCLVTTFIKLC